MKLAKSSGKVNARRIVALKYLQSQLKDKFKQPKGTFLHLDRITLSEDDATRIKKEIATLQSRIVSEDVARSTRTKKKK